MKHSAIPRGRKSIMRLYHFILASIFFLGISNGGTPSVFLYTSSHSRTQSEQLGPYKSENSSDLEQVLTAFLEAARKSQVMEMYQYLSTEDRETFSLQKWSEYYQKWFLYSSDPLVLMLIDRVTYEIEEIKLDNYKATAIVELSQPILLRMSDSDREMAKEQIIKSDTLAMETSTISYNLIREQSGWKIRYDLAIVARLDSIRALVDEAR
ncbi:MAG: hypothetical protein V3U35_00905, partial [Candidatus Neomarinimicrobiota bacterium]